MVYKYTSLSTGQTLRIHSPISVTPPHPVPLLCSMAYAFMPTTSLGQLSYVSRRASDPGRSFRPCRGHAYLVPVGA